MPIYSLKSEIFAAVVSEAIGELEPNQVSYKTGISDEYIRKMRKGQVPSKAILEKLAAGLEYDIHKLLVAAGYEQDQAELEYKEGTKDMKPEARLALTRIVVDIAHEVKGMDVSAIEKYFDELKGEIKKSKE